VLAPTLAAMSALEVILLRKNHKSLVGVVKILWLEIGFVVE
jgi:hypothetical protein